MTHCPARQGLTSLACVQHAIAAGRWQHASAVGAHVGPAVLAPATLHPASAGRAGTTTTVPVCTDNTHITTPRPQCGQMHPSYVRRMQAAQHAAGSTAILLCWYLQAGQRGSCQAWLEASARYATCLLACRLLSSSNSSSWACLTCFHTILHQVGAACGLHTLARCADATPAAHKGHVARLS